MSCPRCDAKLSLLRQDFDRTNWTSTFGYWCFTCNSFLTETFTEEGSTFVWGDWRSQDGT